MNAFFIAGELLFIGLVLLAMIIVVPLGYFIDFPRLFFVLGGGFGLLLTSFSFEECRGAVSHAFGGAAKKDELRRSAYLWECGVRSFVLMGTVGTVIGLVQTLARLSDPKQIGPAIAVALLTLIYGIFFSVIFPLPAHFMIKKRIATKAGPDKSERERGPWLIQE